MKVLTNIRFVQTAGIAQVLKSFLDFVEKDRRASLSVVGVNITHATKNTHRINRKKNISTVTLGTKIPAIKDVFAAATSIHDIKKGYIDVIESYRWAIRKEKPDLVLINGTYFLPWCLFMAAKEEGIPAVLHYHGVLSMETQNWPEKERRLFLKMEKSFDSKGVFYIFPSNLTKETVEKNVYKHKIKNFEIIPNPVPEYFFKVGKRFNNIDVGVVTRWAKVKNTDFCKTLAEYNKKRGSRFRINVVTDLEKGDDRYAELSKIAKIYPAMSNRKLADFYGKMGLIISPSHFETYGNVPKEAVASGVPAIINCNMGVSETFKKIGLGEWVANFASVKSVYEKAEEIIGGRVDKKIRTKMRSLYSSKKIFGKIIKTLNQVYLRTEAVA